VRIILRRGGIVERFGKYKETLPAGLNIVVPFVDRVRTDRPAGAGRHRRSR
jgi:regulator of protease activity HflC (stomatin/prohibitin superfamily)